MASHTDHLPMNQMALALKHKVFLSHSGAQKDFVEQLNLDLKQCDRHAFFDKDRECLPIGENFPDLIFDAIKQCEVGVVILSNEFLSTKWPMVELVDMVRRLASEGDRMILMPIFFRVSVEDLKVEKNKIAWRTKWEEFAKNDTRIDMSKWERALTMLNPTNGLTYNSGTTEVEFREMIVKEICAKVFPYLPWDDSRVQGKPRLIEIIERKKTSVPSTHEIRLGLYGVGGIGKTTGCKFLCNHFEKEFYGKVCHVEVGKGMEEENLCKILKKFTKAQQKDLEELSIDTRYTKLNIMKETVFLAIDNLSSDSKVIEEVRKYLGVGYQKGSILVVTARTLDQLKEVMDAKDCRPMPGIEEHEAKNIFCLHAEVKGEIKDEILAPCINRCKFDKGKGDGTSHFLPLVLEVLGKHLKGSDPSTWVKRLENVPDVLNPRREKEHPVFATFGISYDALRDEDKDLFLDVAIFHSENSEGVRYHDYGLRSPLYWNVYEWLRLLHDLPNIGEVKQRLNILKTKSLLEKVDDYELIGMHDLWKEFALYEIKAKEKVSQRWVCEPDIVRWTQEDSGDEVELEESILFLGGWDNLERISILADKEVDDGKDLLISACPKLKALRLIDVNMREGSVDLRGLSNLRIMEIHDSEFRILGKMGLLENLRVLMWWNPYLDSRHILKQIGSLKFLTILQLEMNPEEEECDEESSDEEVEYDEESSNEEVECDEESSEDEVSVDLRELRSLQVAEIVYGGFTMLSLSLKLRVLDLWWCFKLVKCLGLENMSRLEVLRLRICPKLETLPNLQNLKNLKVLNISRNKLLTAVSGLEHMVALQQFDASCCPSLQTLPEMSNLTNLQKLNVNDCDMLECIPGMSNLIGLQYLDVSSNLLRDTPHSGMLKNLDKVYISGRISKLINEESRTEEEEEGCNAEEKDDMMEVDNPLNAEASQAVDMVSNQEDGFSYEHNDIGSSRMDVGSNQGDGDHDFVLNKGVNVRGSIESQQALDLSTIEHVSGSLKLEDINCELINLHKLTKLESLEIRNCCFKRLPDMGNHMRLKSLQIYSCEDLRSWDGVGGLELIEPNIDVTLPCNWTMSHLVRLELSCHPIQLPDLSHFPQLTMLRLVGRSSLYIPGFSGFALYCQDVHVKLQELRISDWPIIEFPDLSKFSSLKTLYISGCKDLTSLISSKPLTTLKTLSLALCKNLKVLPSIPHMKDLRSFTLSDCGVTLTRHEWRELSQDLKCHIEMKSGSSHDEIQWDLL